MARQQCRGANDPSECCPWVGGFGSQGWLSLWDTGNGIGQHSPAGEQKCPGDEREKVAVLEWIFLMAKQGRVWGGSAS